MDKAAWQAQRELAIEAEVGERAARFEAWSRPHRFLAGVATALACGSLGAALIVLLWQKDPTGALVAASVPAAAIVVCVVWFTVAPGHLLRAMARSQTSSTDPAESPPWTI
jgi:multisubunit Na+/H+ antiporter MnhB subunit